MISRGAAAPGADAGGGEDGARPVDQVGRAKPNSARKAKPGSFDRIRPEGSAGSASGRRDPQGKQVLFSGADQPASLGSVALTCPNCDRRTVVSMVRLAQLALPGVVVPLPGKRTRAWVKCPACAKRGWLQVTVGR